jgi:PAS domain S-box-containing protein
VSEAPGIGLAAPAPRQVHWAAALVLTAIAYALVGVLALKLAIPPGYASPLFPSAGIALAAALTFGWRVLPGVAIGSLCVNLTLNAQRGQLDLTALALPLLIAVGAALQAGAGAWLVRRFVRQPLTLNEPRDVLLFFVLGAGLASLVSACTANAALWQAGTVAVAQLPESLFTWWAGDCFGTLIGAPIALTLIGQPRDDWAPRRLPLGLTLTLVTGMMSLAILQVARWDRERLQNNFERDAAAVNSALSTQLQEPMRALEAMHGVYIASTEVTRAEFHRATQAWLQAGTLQAIGWSERVPRAELPVFEDRMRAEGLDNFRVFDRGAANDADVVAIRFIEPALGNGGALGVNALSIPAAREAIRATQRTARPAATAGFRLTQAREGDPQTGVVVYQAVYNGSPTTAEERTQSLRGVVFVTLRMDALLAAMNSRFPSYLSTCIIDTDPAAPQRRLAGAPDCETRPASLSRLQTLAYSGRQWDLRVYADITQMPDASRANAWMFSLVGLLAAAMLGALLLTVTGRTRRIETAVRQRTAALTAEVHDREQAQAALRESEQRFRNILNNVPIGVIYTDLGGNVKQTNPRFCELTGYSDDELRAMSAREYTHPDDLQQDIELSSKLVQGELPMYRRRKRYVTREGKTVWVQVTVSLLRDAEGRPHRIVGVVEDISEHLRLEQAEQARELAEAANRAKSEFLSRMSHELRTPLNAMLGFAQLLELDRRQPLTTEQRPWVSQIQQAGWHLLEMINDVLDLSRIESGNIRLTSETLHLPDLVTATLAMVDGDARKRDIVVSVALGERASTVLGDATRIKQILTNLLTNAVKYNREGGRVHVASRLRGDSVEIAVTDTGLGMTDSQLGELFQPFNRLGRERGNREGTGIGLVISRRLAELMGGSLKARSISGEGSVFILTLPGASDPDTVPSSLDSGAALSAGYHRRIVHYVEDNETNVEVMRGILSQRPQVQMDVSTTGLDGLAAIRQRRPDLVLLDMHLPDISGLELLRHLKSDPSTAGIVVVAVSADATAKQISAALEAGAERYLTKPVSVHELLAVVDEYLDRVETRFG